MADEKLNVSPEENPQPSLFDTGPAGAPGEVSVSADQIEKLMAERRAAERAEVEKNEPPEPEQPPTPTTEDKAAGEKGPDKKGKAAKEKEPAPEDKPKEEKAGPGEPGGTGARRGRPAKADKLVGMVEALGPAFADFAPGLAPFDWLTGIVGAVAIRLVIYQKSKKAQKYRRDEEYGSAR